MQLSERLGEPDYTGQWNQDSGPSDFSRFSMYILKREQSEDSEKISGLIVDDAVNTHRYVFSAFSGEIRGRIIRFEKVYQPGVSTTKLSYLGGINVDGNVGGVYDSRAPGIKGTFKMSPVKQPVEASA